MLKFFACGALYCYETLLGINTKNTLCQEFYQFLNNWMNTGTKGSLSLIPSTLTPEEKRSAPSTEKLEIPTER